MKKLLKKLGKRPDREPDPAVNPGTPSQQAEDALTHMEKFGLFKLHDDQQSPHSARQYPVNIIAVHGLNGDAYSTWTDSKTGTLWLRDLLPTLMPGCRVFTYGYPSQIVFNRSFADVSEYARKLLDSIRGVWEDWPESTRSIIFVCHSLGGIVCKQALVHAHEDDNLYGNILKSIGGIIFLGTPHRGSGMADIGTIVGSLVNMFTTTTSVGLLHNRVIRRDLLDHLSTDSTALEELSLSVRNRFLGLKIVSCHETNPVPPLNFLIVEKASATLGIPGEDVVPLFEDHRSMCRFAGETDSYRSVSRAILRVAEETMAQGHSRNRAVIRSPERSLDEYEKSCMAVFSAFDVSDYQKSLSSPAAGTCQWILRHPIFLSWLEKASTALLWLTGPPGCGKTILSLFLARHFEETQRHFSPKSVYVYFCDDKIAKQKDANGVLLGLIFQIICRHRSLIWHVKREFEMQGTNIVRSFKALWNVCMRIVMDPKCGATCIIIDALDECEEDTRRTLLDAIYDLTSRASPVTSCVKFILTSRPLLGGQDARVDHQVAEHHILIGEGQSGYLGDLHTFIQQRVDQIAKERSFSSETRRFLKENLSSKAGETFLWVHMVLASLEKSLVVSKKSLQDLLASIPPDLEATYLEFLESIPPDHQATAAKLLQLVLGASRPLTLEELNIAFTVDANHRTVGDVIEDWQESIQHTVQGVLGPLVRLSDFRVLLVHQSVKDFLLQQKRQENIPAAVQQITPASSALSISTSCVYYLLLEDFSNDLFAPDDGSTLASLSTGTYSASPAKGPSVSEVEVKELDMATLFKEPETLEGETCRLIAERHALYGYASLNWTKHYAVCETLAPAELRDSAHRLLDIGIPQGANWWRFYAAELDLGSEDIPQSPSRLTLAAYFGLTGAVVDELRDRPPPLEARGDALFWAAHEGHTQAVLVLLEAGADPNAPGPDRNTPLTIAARNGHLSALSALLRDPHTDVNARGRKGKTALSLACSHQHPTIAQALLATPGCDANIPDDSGATPLMIAARVADHDTLTVAALLAHSTTDPNHRDRAGRTALSWAAGDGVDLAVRALLDNNNDKQGRGHVHGPRHQHRAADPNLPDATGRTPLSWAAGNGRTSTVRLLLKKTSSSSSSSSSSSPLSSRGTTGKDVKAIDPCAADRTGRNPVSWAAGNGHADTLRALLRHGAAAQSADVPDADGWAPLAWAVQCETPGAVEALLSASSAASAAAAAAGGGGAGAGRSGGGAAAARGPAVPIAIDLERRDHGGGRTALAWAVEYGRVPVVRALLEAGADPRARDNQGISIVEAARAKGPGWKVVLDMLELAERKKAEAG